MSALGQVPTFFFASLARGVVQLKCYILSYRTSPTTASSVNSIEETSFRHTQLSFTHELLSRAFLYRHLLRSCLAPSAYFHALSRSKLRNCSNLSLTNTCWWRDEAYQSRWVKVGFLARHISLSLYREMGKLNVSSSCEFLTLPAIIVILKNEVTLEALMRFPRRSFFVCACFRFSNHRAAALVVIIENY